MEPFEIHILGCGSALPTTRHNASSQVVRIGNKQFMIDCGEGTQLQLRRRHIHFSFINHIFISHLHGDHCFGLIGLISTFGLLGRTAPLHIYADPMLEKTMRPQLDFFCKEIKYPIFFHNIDACKHAVIFEDNTITVETLPQKHRIPCCGFTSVRSISVRAQDFVISRQPLLSGSAFRTPDAASALPRRSRYEKLRHYP